MQTLIYPVYSIKIFDEILNELDQLLLAHLIDFNDYKVEQKAILKIFGWDFHEYENEIDRMWYEI